MQSFILSSPDELKRYLMLSFKVFMPNESCNDDVRWLALDSNNSPDFNADLASPISGCKSFFFPEREQIFQFDGEKFVSTEPRTEKQVLFGVHACDLTAIAYQDRFFSEDIYYQSRRQNTLLVGVDCIKQCTAGFCHQLDAGPFVNVTTADLVLQPMNENYSEWALFATSQQGAEVIEGMPLKNSDKNNSLLSRQAAQNDVVSGFEDAPHLTQGIEKINRQQVPQTQWESLAMQCVTCTGCTQVCPTCSCYATRDLCDDDAVSVKRERIWDSCLFEGFQKEASGHNPAKLAGQRLERFWYHKFSDDFLDSFDRYGCVGCGRCEQVCPGVIGVHSIMERLNDGQ